MNEEEKRKLDDDWADSGRDDEEAPVEIVIAGVPVSDTEGFTLDAEKFASLVAEADATIRPLDTLPPDPPMVFSEVVYRIPREAEEWLEHLLVKAKNVGDVNLVDLRQLKQKLCP